MTVAWQICILEYGVSLSCKRELKRTQTKTGVFKGGGGKIHANINAAKRELRNALFSSNKKKVIGSNLSPRLCRRHGLVNTKEELTEKLLKAKIVKRKSCHRFTQIMPEIGNAQRQFFECKHNFLKRDQNAAT